jgi:YbgC/YbaW family acyl-CoA thioester hydrolase
MTDVRGLKSEMRTKRRVAFSETDAAGLVHFTYFFRYFEDAEHALWRDAGLSIHADGAAIGWPRISASCEFHRPLRFEQEFDVIVRITEMTNRTITYSGEIRSNDQRVATSAWKVACVTKLPDGSMRTTDIPSHVADRLTPSEPRITDRAARPTDHAPRTTDIS